VVANRPWYGNERVAGTQRKWPEILREFTWKKRREYYTYNMHQHIHPHDVLWTVIYLNKIEITDRQCENMPHFWSDVRTKMTIYKDYNARTPDKNVLFSSRKSFFTRFISVFYLRLLHSELFDYYLARRRKLYGHLSINWTN